MQIVDFKLERYFAEHEFKVRYLLSASDCEALALDELLGVADAESLALWRDLKLSYTESQGHPQLRAEVAGLYRAIRPEDVLIAAPEELIFIAMNALLRPGDHVIATYPGYQSLYAIAGVAGLRSHTLAFDGAPEWVGLRSEFPGRPDPSGDPTAGNELPAQSHRLPAGSERAGCHHRACPAS